MNRKLPTSEENEADEPKKVLEYSYDDMETSVSDGADIGEELKDIILVTVGWLDLKEEDIDPDDLEAVGEFAEKLIKSWGIDEPIILNPHQCDWYWGGSEQKHKWDNAWQLTFQKVDTNAYTRPKTFEIPVEGPVYQDYDKLDEIMKEHNFLKPEEQSWFPEEDLSGWIATMGDKYTDPTRQIEDLNQKIELVCNKKFSYNVKFNQTGHFSVGYTIYIKK